jgi:hypothetical protein
VQFPQDLLATALHYPTPSYSSLPPTGQNPSSWLKFKAFQTGYSFSRLDTLLFFSQIQHTLLKSGLILSPTETLFS